MADWADISAYDEMIEELRQFCNQLNSASETMLAAAQKCVAALSNDVASMKESKQVALSVKGYLEAIQQAQALAAALEEERQDIIDMVKTIDDRES